MCEENNSIENIFTNKAITIRALQRHTRGLISTFLNPERYIPSEKGVQRDWRGLAELCEISGERIPSLAHSRDPSNQVLDIWIVHNKEESTIDRLFSFFEDLDRFDIIYEITPSVEKDIENFKENINGVVEYPFVDEREILTVDDGDRKNKGLPLQTYDAFVLFADDDIDFAAELINTMENDYKLKLCVKDRDLIVGAIEHDAIIQLISRRCGRLIVIVSPSFFESPVHKYLFDVARLEGIENRRRKIISCLIKPCDNLPPDFKLYVILDYKRNGIFYDFYKKLFQSIKNACLLENEGSNSSMETLKQNSIKFNSTIDVSVEETPLETITPVPLYIPKEESSSTSEANGLESDVGTLKKKKSIYKKIVNAFTKQLEGTNNECDDKRCTEKVKKKSKKKLKISSH